MFFLFLTTFSGSIILKGQQLYKIVTEKPDVKWSDIAGLEIAKKAL